MMPEQIASELRNKDAETTCLRALLDRAMAIHVDGETYAVREDDGRWHLKTLIAWNPWSDDNGPRSATLDELLAAVESTKESKP